MADDGRPDTTHQERTLRGCPRRIPSSLQRIGPQPRRQLRIPDATALQRVYHATGRRGLQAGRQLRPHMALRQRHRPELWWCGESPQPGVLHPGTHRPHPLHRLNRHRRPSTGSQCALTDGQLCHRRPEARAGALSLCIHPPEPHKRLWGILRARHLH